MMRSFKKRVTALACAVMMTVSSLTISTPTTVEAHKVESLTALSRQAAAEGCVLLKNDNNVLPLAKNTKVAVFGRVQCNYVACGTGSGGSVKTSERISILQGLEKSGMLQINNDLKNKYSNWAKTHNDNPDEFAAQFDKSGRSRQEMPLEKSEVEAVKKQSDVAVVILGRESGEDRDLSFTKGSLLLTDVEKNMLKNVSEVFDKVVVVLNSTGIIDMSWVEEYPKIDSVLYAWTGGEQGGHGVADVITGKVNPSGKLTDTIAKNYKDYPTYENYGMKELYYQEDVYVGYRYFETFAQDKVAYPFGFGLSYTTFDTKFQRATEENGYIKVVATVTNTGKVKGKEVVQVYYGAPQNGMGNPVKELAAFAKTKELNPGESETISLNFKIKDMASYDDGGMYKESAYVLEPGEYKIYLGNSARDCKQVHTYNQKQVDVVEQLQEAAAPVQEFKRYKAVESNGKISLTTEDVPQLHTNIEERLNKNMPKEYTRKDSNVYSLKDVYDGKLTMEEFVAQMTPEQMGMLSQGSADYKEGEDATDGGASRFGGVQAKDDDEKTQVFLSDKYGIPVAVTADGPSGISISDNEKNGKCTMIPCGNVLGCTWNLELIEDLFDALGEELVLNSVDSLLGPGINIKRDPRCGRNFEYLSEDPLLTGRMAAVMVKAVQARGATLTAKHFACNNCEANKENLDSIRGTADAIISERALREIYLKVFEIYVKEGNARSIMTAYNPINGCWAASNYDLNTTILRGEWGYDGIVMSDWWANMSYQPWATDNHEQNDKFSDRQMGTMLKAQNDIWMTLDNKVAYDENGNAMHRNGINGILDDYKKGYLKKAEMQRCAINLCNYLMKSQAFSRKYNIPLKTLVEKYKKQTEEWFTVEKAEEGNPAIAKITIDGREVASFNRNVLEYKVYLSADATKIPTVVVTPENGTTVNVEQATLTNRTAVIKATEKNVTTEYRIVFTDEDGIVPVFKDAALASLSDIQVDGKSLQDFDKKTYSYMIAVDALDNEPEVTWTALENVTVKKTYDKTAKAVTLRAIAADQAVSYKIAFGMAPQSDEFEGTELNKFWTIEQPDNDKWELKDGHLTIKGELGSIFGKDQDNLKNRFVQSACGDWEAVVKIDLPKFPTLAYQSLGAIVMEDQNNYVYVKMESDGKGVGISLCKETDGNNETLETISEVDESKFTDAMYVKLTKLGDTYLSAVSPDGENYIDFSTVIEAKYENPKFMLVNGNGDQNLSEALEAKFDYVKFNKNPGEVVTIGADTKLKLAEVAPVVRGAALKAERCNDTDGGRNFFGFVADQDLAYKIHVEKTGYYNLVGRIASSHEGLEQFRMASSIDGVAAGEIFSKATGGAWQNMSLGDNVKLTAGDHIVKLHTIDSGFEISFSMNWLQFKLVKEIEDGELRAAVNAAKAKDMSLYSEEDQKKYIEAIAAAEQVLISTEKKEEFDAALKALKEVEATLVELGSVEIKAELRIAVEAAKAILDAGQGNYSDVTWKLFTDAYNAAAAPKEDAGTEELTQLKKALTDAVAGLKQVDNADDPYDPYKPGQEDIETVKAALAQAVNTAKVIFEAGQDDYEATTWKVFEEAYKAAANPAADATVEDLKELTTALEKAQKDLRKESDNVPVDVEQLKANLAEAVGEAKELIEAGQDDYTNSTWRLFTKAYEAAEKVLEKEDATAEELTECLEDLDSAKSKLKKNTPDDNQNPEESTTPDENPEDGDDSQAGQNSPIGQKPQTSGQPTGNQQPTAQYMNQVQVTVDKTTLYVGGDKDNTATVKVNVPGGAAIQKVTYATSNTSVATVSATGVVTARKANNIIVRTNVTLTNGETKEFTTNLSIEKARIEKVKVQPTVKIGKKTTLRAIVHGSSKRIVWKIKKGSKYAKVTKAGKLTAKAKGTVKVQAKAGKISKTFTIRIK